MELIVTPLLLYSMLFRDVLIFEIIHTPHDNFCKGDQESKLFKTALQAISFQY